MTRHNKEKDENHLFKETCTVGEIYTQILSSFQEIVVNVAILELGPVTNVGPAWYFLSRDIFWDFKLYKLF